MSYDLYLVDPATERVVELDTKHHLRGGTYVLSGTTRAEFNITYNYGQHFRKVFEPIPATELTKQFAAEDGLIYGIRSIYGLTTLQSIPILMRAILMLGTDTHPNYWEPTEGNARDALIQLSTLAHYGAMVNKNCIWMGD